MKFNLKEIINKLKISNETIVTAESCTAGLISKTLTDPAGSSLYYWGGFVVYANSAKEKLLSVKKNTLDKYGAVSEQVAIEMTQGALNNSEGTIALAVTGIAGPDGGTDDKPVGLVFGSIQKKGNKAKVLKFNFSGTRESIRKQTVESMLIALYDYITV